MSIYESSFFAIYCCAVAFILGACLGSFLNCTAIRIGTGESFVRGHSHCTVCGHELGVRDLVPIFSWVFLRGKCRYCHAKISARYPAAEIVFALVSVACLLKFDLTWLCLRNYIFLAVLFLLTLTDLDTMIIPDSCHIIAAAAWFASAPLLYTKTEVLTHIAAATVFGGGILLLSLVMDRIMGRETMGGGDIKLLAVTGLYFGFIGTLLTLVLSCVTGLVFNVLHKNKDKEFPFGPWIAAAAAVVLFAGDPLIRWYSGLIG